MARVLCVWELGGGYGHVAGFLDLALRLRDRGHDVSFAVRDLSRAEAVLGSRGFRLLQAPVWLRQVGPTVPVNYAEMLYEIGFLDRVGLLGLVRAWRSLFQLARPELLIVDHAPTALLAAVGTAIPRALYGPGFFSPPRLTPMPSIRPWLKVPPDRLLESETRVLAVMNQVLAALDVAPLATLSALFEVEEDFLTTLPELDHYQGRGGARYWGPSFSLDSGVVPEWPAGDGPRIFAYVAADHRDFERLLGALTSLPYPTLVHARSAPVATTQRYRAPNLRFSSEPVTMRLATREADLVICQGSGTTAAALLAGKPVLILSQHLEQMLTGLHVANRGLGSFVTGDAKAPNYRQIVRQLLSDSDCSERARRFAEKYASFDQGAQLDAIVARCEELVAR